MPALLEEDSPYNITTITTITINTFAKFKTDLEFGNQNTIFCASMVIKLQYID